VLVCFDLLVGVRLTCCSYKNGFQSNTIVVVLRSSAPKTSVCGTEPGPLQALAGWAALVDRFAAMPLTAATAIEAVEAGVLHVHAVASAHGKPWWELDGGQECSDESGASGTDDRTAEQLDDLAAHLRQLNPTMFGCEQAAFLHAFSSACKQGNAIQEHRQAQSRCIAGVINHGELNSGPNRMAGLISTMRDLRVGTGNHLQWSVATNLMQLLAGFVMT
jgi:hypothetical protein